MAVSTALMRSSMLRRHPERKVVADHDVVYRRPKRSLPATGNRAVRMPPFSESVT